MFLTKLLVGRKNKNNVFESELDKTKENKNKTLHFCIFPVSSKGKEIYMKLS